MDTIVRKAVIIIDEKKYQVYIHTNKINNKKYVGQTCQTLLQRSGREGQRYAREPKFFAAIQKYGWENFTHEIIYRDLTKEEANYYEQYLIKKYHTFGTNGYNLTDGGNNYYPSEEIRQKISEKISGPNNGMYGKRHTLEARQKMSKGQRNFWDNISKEDYERICANKQGGKNGRAKPVKCLETNIIYPCARDAGEAMGHHSRVQGGINISNAIRNHYKSFGYHWEYV